MAAKTVGSDRRRFWIMMFLGSAPDLDVLFSGLGSWASMLQHRGLSHSFVGIVLQALLYAWAFARWDQGTFRTRAFHYSLPLALHVLCDYLTCFGVPVLLPFSTVSFSADLMMDLCVIPMVAMGAGLYFMHRKEVHGWSVTRPLWGIWVVYMIVAATGKAYAMKLAESPAHMAVTALPTKFNPFNWRAVSHDDKTRTYTQVSVDLIRGRRKSAVISAMPIDDFAVQASLKSPEVKMFLDTNRWPVVRVTPTPSHGYSVEWGNLLFSARGLVRGKVRVEIASNGAILGQEKIFNFWNPQNVDSI
jgi:inner membrane protein